MSVQARQLPSPRAASAPLGNPPGPATPASGPHVPPEAASLGVRFGLRLRELRRARGMTQLQIAVEFGIDRTFLSDLERGRKSVSLPFIEIFALGYGLSISQLLDKL